jgi:hypothetical protein
MSYAEGDWVMETYTGRVGILIKKNCCEVSIRFGKAAAMRYPEMVELAPLDIRQDDLIAMQHLAVEIGDKEWFTDLGNRMGEKAHG